MIAGKGHRRNDQAMNPDQASTSLRVYYRPIEAAIRWCGLQEHEQTITRALLGKMMPEAEDFPAPDVPASPEWLEPPLQITETSVIPGVHTASQGGDCLRNPRSSGKFLTGRSEIHVSNQAAGE